MHAAVAAAEEIVEEATGTAPAETGTGQPNAPLRSGSAGSGVRPRCSGGR
jgi:hypothetical protein